LEGKRRRKLFVFTKRRRDMLALPDQRGVVLKTRKRGEEGGLSP